MTKKWRVVIVDDEQLARESLKNMLDILYEDMEVVGVAENKLQALALFNTHQEIDGVFMDIRLEEDGSKAGVDLAISLNQRTNPPWFIFTTAYSEHAIETLNNVRPIGYLLKPLNSSELDNTLNYMRQNWSRLKTIPNVYDDNEHSIEISYKITQGTAKQKCKRWIKPSEIVYLRKNKNINSVQIKLVNSDLLDEINGTLESWQKKLNYPYFLQIHRSYFINLRQAQSIHQHPFQHDTYQLSFKCFPDDHLTIGEMFYQQLVEKLQNGAYE
jgi:DNA-binding LytR/AlgR family response regulator